MPIGLPGQTFANEKMKRTTTTRTRAERGLCLSTGYGAGHDGFSEYDFSGEW